MILEVMGMAPLQILKKDLRGFSPVISYISFDHGNEMKETSKVCVWLIFDFRNIENFTFINQKMIISFLFRDYSLAATENII